MKKGKFNYFVLTSFILMLNAITLVLYTFDFNDEEFEIDNQDDIEMITDIEEEEL